MAAWPEPMRAAVPALIEVTPVLVRNGREVGLIYDGSGCAMIASLSAGPADLGDSGPPLIAELAVAELASLFDLEIVLHADLAAGDPASPVMAAYRNLGYHRIPRSQSAWIVLRQRAATAGAGTGADEAHALVEHATQELDRLPGPVRSQLADAETARELVGTEPLAARFGAAPGVVIQLVPRRRPDPSAGADGQLAYRLTRWPDGGLPALQQALAAIAALSVTTTVAVGAGRSDQVELTATIRVEPWPLTPGLELEQAITAAATGCGACLEPLPTRLPSRVRVSGRATGLVTLTPIRLTVRQGRISVPPVRAGSVTIPIAPGGVVLATQSVESAESLGEPVAVSFFTAAGTTRSTVIGDPVLPKVIALRALGAGARLQVITSRPREWLRLRGCARLPAGSMTVVRPGTPQPVDGTRTAPWMIIDDTSDAAASAVVAAEAGAGRPWLAYVAAPDAGAATLAALRGMDAVILHRSTPACRAAVIAALDLPVPVTRSLHGIPREVVAIASPGMVRLGPLEYDPLERAVIRRSMRPLPPGPANSAWPAAVHDVEEEEA